MSPATFFFTAVLQAAALSAGMTLAWALWRRTGNSGWIDAVWTFTLGWVGVVSSLLPLSEGGPEFRRILVAGLIAVWSLRLGLHIVGRTLRRADDPRYAELARGWGADASRQMFFLVQKQALVTIPLALSVFVAAQNPSPNLRVQDIAAVLLVLIAIAGESLADRQLQRHIRRTSGSNAICDQGLWSWSRHPNYFFECLHWTAYPVLAIGMSGNYPWGYIALGGPIFMYWLLVYVSGIPPLEAHMLRRHGDAYRAYQERTNAFFPSPPRSKMS